MSDYEYAICWKCKHNLFDGKGIAYEKGIVSFKCQSCDEQSMGFSGQKAVCHSCGQKWNVCVFCGAKLK